MPTVEQIFPGAASGDEFGLAVAISGDGSTLAVTAPLANGGKGYLYVFTGPGFATKTTLAASGGTAADGFGQSVAVSDDGGVIAVGAPTATSGAGKGKAWVFHGPAWGSQTVVTGSDLAGPSDHFGASVAVSGDGTVVGAGAPGFASSAGKAYLYHGASWGTEKKITGTGTTTGSQFGSSAALSTDGAVFAVGAQNDPASGPTHNAGKAFVFSGAAWATETALTALTPIVNGQFGTSVALSGTGSILAVGAPPFAGVGKAYVRTGAGYASQTILTPSDSGAGFGRSVAITSDGVSVLVGADLAGGGAGQAYLYNAAAWAAETIFAPSDGVAGNEFGFSVSLATADLLLAGSWGWGPAGSQDATGAAYLFTTTTIPPIPAGSIRSRPAAARIIVTDLTGRVLAWLDRGHLLEGSVVSNLGLPSQISGSVRSGDRAVNALRPPPDGDPLVAQSNRLVYVFLNEDPLAAMTETRWVPIAAGILMSPQDQADPDIGTTHFAAYDPWQYFMGLPCFEDHIGTPIRQSGFLFPGVPGNQIAFTMIQNTYLSLLALGYNLSTGFFADIPPGYDGTAFWAGTDETTPQLDFRVQQGTSLGQLLQNLASAGNDLSGTSQCIDIVFEPIYDPDNRPGFTSQISIFDLAGTVKPKAPMAWGRFIRSATTADREHDGTPGAFVNVAQFVAGQGGDLALSPILDSTADIAKYGSYWLQKFFPAQPIATVVENLAVQALQLQKQGKRTFLVDVNPLRAAMPFRDYQIGDRIPVFSPKAQRVAAEGYQRVQTIPLEIGPDGTSVVKQLLTSPDWPQDSGS